MSRSWSLAGHNHRGDLFIREKAIKTKVEKCPICDHVTGGQVLTKVYEKSDRWYGEMLSLNVYTHRDGRKFEDFIQEEPWSSGPVTFLALRWSDTKKPIVYTLWKGKEIDEYL